MKFSSSTTTLKSSHPPKEATFGFVINNNQILLTLRRDVSVWVLPGGGIEPGETPEVACLREVYEETAVQCELIRKTHELYPVNKLAHATHLFMCKPLNEPSPNSNESLDNRYFDLKNLPSGIFWAHKLWIEEAIFSHNLIKRNLNEISYKKLVIHLISHPWQTLRFAWTRLTKS